METEFKPTKQDLSSIHDRLSELKIKKDEIVKRKIIVQQGLSVYAEKYQSVTMGSPEYDQIKESRSKLKAELNYLEGEITKIKQEVSFKNKLKSEVELYLKSNRPENSVIGPTLSRLVSLKKKYQDFAVDRTRVASLRVMASEISTELEKVINEVKKL